MGNGRCQVSGVRFQLSVDFCGKSACRPTDSVDFAGLEADGLAGKSLGVKNIMVQMEFS